MKVTVLDPTELPVPVRRAQIDAIQRTTPLVHMLADQREPEVRRCPKCPSVWLIIDGGALPSAQTPTKESP